ncbi:MAG: sensor histidine kinase [Clostridia bacterium]|nr:sensor histidine kinase [Clostridia bacterium]
MKELSLNILDIAQNSIHAEATIVRIILTETDETLKLEIEDDGKGMSEEFLARVTDPFSTTRKTRKVGLGLPLLKLAAEQTGGHMTISSREKAIAPDHHGTEVAALFYKNHLDFTPLGDVISTVVSLVQGSPDVDFVFVHEMPDRTVELDTRELREVLGEDIPLSSPDVLVWIRESLTEQYGTGD